MQALARFPQSSTGPPTVQIAGARVQARKKQIPLLRVYQPVGIAFMINRSDNPSKSPRGYGSSSSYTGSKKQRDQEVSLVEWKMPF